VPPPLPPISVPRHFLFKKDAFATQNGKSSAMGTSDLQVRKAKKGVKKTKKKGQKASFGFQNLATSDPIPMSEVVSAEDYAKRIEPRVQPTKSTSFEDKMALRKHMPVEVQHPDTDAVSKSKNSIRKRQLRNEIRYMTPRDSRKLLGLNPKRHKKVKTTAGH
jgi:hypothetical protein